MTQLWMAVFEHYGTGTSGRLNMLNGPWAELTDGRVAPVTPPFPARAGSGALRLTVAAIGIFQDAIARRVIATSQTTIFCGFGFYSPQLPDVGGAVMLFGVTDNLNDPVCAVFLNSDGSITARGPSTRGSLSAGFETGALVGASAGPVIEAGTWQHIEIGVSVDAAVGTLEVRIDEQVILNLTNINLGSDAPAQLVFGKPQQNVLSPQPSVPEFVYYDDIVARDAAGSSNNDFEGDLRVVFLQPLENAMAQGWTARTISNLGIGVLQTVDSNRDSGLSFSDNANLELGSGDYCIEGFFRFDAKLIESQNVTLASKYRTDIDARSWQLVLRGPSDTGNLEFRTSTDGTLVDRQTVHSFPFDPEASTWYHIAVTREGTTSRLFIDGQQVGVDQTDNRTYFNGSARLAVAGQFSSSVLTDNQSLSGWVDGFRLTVGAARYTANFAVPTGPLPTDLMGDSLFNNVQLLLNFDEDAVTDQSANGFTGTLEGQATQLLPDDALAYQTIDGQSPNDSNFIEAAIIPATGTLSLPSNPLDTETVTLGSTTYTFQTTLVDAANNVLIGATPTDSLNNLRAAVNLEAGAGTTYGTGTVQNADAALIELPNNQALAEARTPGAAGNTIATTTTVTGASWSAATLQGGQDIPGNSEFRVSNLPLEATGVRAVAVVTRAFKTDAGTSRLQSSFVVESGASSQGTARAVTLNPTYYEDTFEQDPGTLGALTTNSLLNARIRVDRTE